LSSGFVAQRSFFVALNISYPSILCSSNGKSLISEEYRLLFKVSIERTIGLLNKGRMLDFGIFKMILSEAS
jgi:hypothetical protein